MNGISAGVKGWTGWLIRLAKIAIGVLVVWGIWHTVSDAGQQLAVQHFSVGQIRLGWLLAACGFYGAGMVPMWWYWHQILWALGQQPAVGDSIKAYFVGQLGKYVPGKATVVVLRAAFVRSERVDTTVAAVSVFVETLTMMAVGAFVAGAIIAVHFSEHGWLQVVAWLSMIATGVPTLPPLFRRVVGWLQVARVNPGVTDALRGLTYRLMLRGWMASAASWFLYGASLWATLQAVPLGSPGGALGVLVWRLTATVTLAVVAGFVSLVPGGLGVRELVLNELMVPEFGEAKALVCTVLLRVGWLVTELVISAILYLGIRGRKRI